MAKTIYGSWKRLVRLLKLDSKDIRQIFYYAVFAGFISLSLPLGIQAIINLIQGAQISTSWIVLVVLVTLGVAFQGTLQIMQMRIIENIQQKIFTRSSFEFTYRFPKIKMNEIYGHYPPELANRFFDTLTLQKSLSKILVDFPTAILQIVFGLALLSFYHPFFIIYGFLLVLLIYIVFKFSAQRGLETSLNESKEKYKVAHWIQEVARSILGFKLSGKTNLALSKNDNLTSKYLDARESHFRVLIQQFTHLIGFKVLVTAGLLLIGGFLVLNQLMNIGQFVAAEIIIIIIINSVEKLIVGLEPIYDTFTSIEKIAQVVDRELEDQEGDTVILDESGSFTLQLEEATYRVPDRAKPILSNINLEVKPKDKLLITGNHGAGKTTLLKVIAGIIEPTSGEVYINDRSLRGLYINDYRSYISQVFPEMTPFEGTIRENLTFGNLNIDDETIKWALEKTMLIDWLRYQPEGLRTIIFPEGKQLSTSIARKLVLARAIITKPKLLLMKDALDQLEKNESNAIMDFLIDDSNPWSLIVVSHNESWSRKCHKIIKLDEGEIVNDK